MNKQEKKTSKSVNPALYGISVNCVNISDIVMYIARECVCYWQLQQQNTLTGRGACSVEDYMSMVQYDRHHPASSSTSSPLHTRNSNLSAVKWNTWQEVAVRVLQVAAVVVYQHAAANRIREFELLLIALSWEIS